MGIRIIETDDPLNDPAVTELRDKLREGRILAPGTSSDTDIREIVRDTIASVKKLGDERVIKDTKDLHGVTLEPGQLRLSEKEIAVAHKEFQESDPIFMGVLRKAIANVREYQESILIKAPQPIKRDGRTLGLVYKPIDRVAVYVPGGKAAYPSSVLMTVVPAQIAGVRDIVMVTPPQRDGSVKPEVWALAGELGIKEIYRVSGVAGLAAVTFGTESIMPVDKIVGPGSAFIVEAKRQLFGQVGIDSVAGPSEVLIIADQSAQPAWLAADMLAQTEHAPGSAVLVTDSGELARKVAEEIEKQVDSLSRAEMIRPMLDENCRIVVVPDTSKACDLANDWATEHLQIITAADQAVLEKIRHAGAIFLGPYTPVPLGDYYAGPSHVLPTGGTARFFGPLSCNDFLKATSVISYDAESFAQDARDVIDFANREGLTAHARSVEIRLED